MCIEKHQILEISKLEFQILELMVEGYSNIRIAKKLHYSNGAIKKKVSDLYKKLKVGNRVSCCVEALIKGIIHS